MRRCVDVISQQVRHTGVWQLSQDLLQGLMQQQRRVCAPRHPSEALSSAWLQQQPLRGEERGGQALLLLLIYKDQLCTVERTTAWNRVAGAVGRDHELCDASRRARLELADRRAQRGNDATLQIVPFVALNAGGSAARKVHTNSTMRRAIAAAGAVKEMTNLMERQMYNNAVQNTS